MSKFSKLPDKSLGYLEKKQILYYDSFIGLKKGAMSKGQTFQNPELPGMGNKYEGGKAI